MTVQKKSVIPLLVAIAATVIIVAGLRAMSGLLSPILLSLFIVLITSPMMARLKQRGLPAWLAYTLVVLGVIVVGLCFILFLAVSLNQLSQELPTYTALIDEQLADLEQWLTQYGVTAADIRALEWFQPENIFQLLFSFISALLGTVGNVGFMLLVFIYMLASAPNFSARLRRGLATDLPLLERFNDFAHSMGTYLLIKSWLGSVTALSQIILMWVMGIDFAVLWGVFSFLFNFVPNIGFYLALIPPLLLALLKFGLVKAAVFGVLYALINNFFDIVVAPRFLGKGLDLSTLVSFLAVVIWTWILGPIGAFMALPLTVMVKKLVLETFQDTQMIGGLLSSGGGETDEVEKSALS